MPRVILGFFNIFFWILYQGDSATLKWKTHNETLYLNEPQIIKDYKIPQATVRLLKPRGFSISIPGDRRFKTIEFNLFHTVQIEEARNSKKRPPTVGYIKTVKYCNQSVVQYENDVAEIQKDCKLGYKITVKFINNTTYDVYWKYQVDEDEYGNFTLHIDTDEFRPKKKFKENELLGLVEKYMPFNFWMA